jgi:hypothetical protein
MSEDSRSEKIRRTHAQNRLKALPPPGRAPYGYRRGKDKYILDRAALPAVKDFFERFLLYGSLRGAVRYLEKKYGKKISIATGRNWLLNPVYRGDSAYGNGDTIVDTHPAIISREDGAQIDRLLRRNRQLPARTASAPRCLAGLVTCSTCERVLHITSVTQPRQSQRYLYLRGTHCPNRPKCASIDYNAVLAATIDRICQDLPPAALALNAPEPAGIKAVFAADIASKKEILNELTELLSKNVLDEESFLLRSYNLKTEIAKIERKMSALPPASLMTIVRELSLAQFWIDLSESERRFYFREFIKQIILNRTIDGSWDISIHFLF